MKKLIIWDFDGVIIEDSLAGLTAAIKANMTTIAYTEHTILDKEKYTNNIKSMGVSIIFYDMKKLKNHLEKTYAVNNIAKGCFINRTR